MDTWEVVVILILLTFSILVIANREIPLSVIELLDNTYFQLAVLGATLAIATLSPPVAIIAISTIVTVYYMRNVVKVQLMKMRIRIEKEREEEIDRINEAKRLEELRKTAEREEKDKEEPRIEISETTETNTVVSTKVVIDKEAIETALQENESRAPPEVLSGNVGSRSSMSGVPLPNIPDPDVVEIMDPRKTNGPRGVESFDSTLNKNDRAPQESYRQLIGGIDSPVFTGAKVTPAAYNEMKAPAKIRAYRDNAGQYNLKESRPVSAVEKYEVADFLPSDEIGSNEFQLIGTSIDDKVSLLSKGVMPSATAPPDFDQVHPAKSR